METPEKNNMMDIAEISFAEIFAFFRKNVKQLAFFAAGTLILAVLLILAVYCFTPRVQSYQKTISLNLATKDEALCYPSEKEFSSADLISRPVLRKVYNGIGLEKQVSFEDFVSSFFIAETNMKKAFLDARFKAKMSARNITIVQIQQLEREYKEALAAVKSNQVTIAMAPQFSCNSVLAARILNAIPAAWFDIYSVQEAALYPAAVPLQQIQGLSKAVGQDGLLILMEKTRMYARQMHQLCSFLNEMLQGRNMMLPSGETLGDLQAALTLVVHYQINMLQQYVLDHPELYGPFDRVFLESRAKDAEFDLMLQEKKCAGVIAAINTLVSDSVPQNAGNGKVVQDAGKAGTAPMTLQLDTGSLASIERLIRKDINGVLRKDLAQKTMEYQDELAEASAEHKRYQDILDAVNGQKKKQSQVVLSTEKFYVSVREMLADLLVQCKKLDQFRKMILQDEHTSRQFCSVAPEVLFSSAPMFPIPRIALGILAVWALVNGGFIFFQFQARKKD